MNNNFLLFNVSQNIVESTMAARVLRQTQKALTLLSLTKLKAFFCFEYKFYSPLGYV